MVSQTQYEPLLRHYANKLHEEMAEPRPVLTDIVNKYRVSFKQAIEFLEQNTRKEQFNLALGNENPQQALLHRFLNAVIQRTNDEVIFHANVALGAKSTLIDPVLPFLDYLDIYTEHQSLSLREQYIRGTLTAQHWLTDLDLQRMTHLCGLDKKVKIMPFTAECIGATLHLMQQDHAETSAPYTIPFLLNQSSAANNKKMHWLAAKITVDPTSRTIHYQIDDNKQLNETELSNYRKIMDEAIRFDNGYLKAFPDSDGWTIDVALSAIRGNDSEKDDYVCGYRALHTLLQDSEICGDYQVAYALATATSDKDLVNAFYKHQLEDLKIPGDIYHALGAKAASRFNPPLDSRVPTVTINEIRLINFLNNLPSQPMDAVNNSDENPAVSGFVRSYSPALSLMRFPSSVKDFSLDAIQYENLFNQLSWIESLSANPLPCLVLTHVDNASLDGLNAFYANNQIKLFKELKLTIDLSDTDEADAFIAKLKFALTNLARSDLNRLIIADEQGFLTQDHINGLLSFIEANKISVAIDLPELFNEKAIQRQFDQTIEINQRLKNNKLLAKANTKPSLENRRNEHTPIRRRERLNLRHTLKIDIELQEGIEEEIAVETLVSKKRSTPEYGAIKVLTLEQLQEAIDTGNFKVFRGVAYGLSKTSLITQWHTIFGNIVHGAEGQRLLINKELSGISTQALAKVCEFHEQFVDGINIRQLPSGFLLIPDPKNPDAQVLHYDANAEPKSTLSPRLITRTIRHPLSMDLVDAIFASKYVAKSSNTVETRHNLQPINQLNSIWQALKTSEPYSRENNVCFRHYVAELLSLNPEQLATILALCEKQGGFDFGKLKFIFNHLKEAKASFRQPYDEKMLVDISWMKQCFSTPETRERFVILAHSIQPKPVLEHPLFTLLANESVNLLNQLKRVQLTDSELNGLLVIYDRYDIAGVEKIVRTWQTIDALPNTNISQLPSILKNVASYESLVVHQDTLLNAAKTINGLAPIQRQWWDKLYQAHQPVDDNLVDLLHSFKEFFKAVEAKGLAFYSLEPIAEPFPNAKNMPTALGRMLSILDLCDPQDKTVQWHAIAQVDLSAPGALRALTDGYGSPRPCGFVIPEMAIDPKTTHSEEVYDTAREYKKIATAKNERLPLFYRFLAHQKYRLPLSFYQEAVSELERLRENNELPDAAVNNLYALLLETTTGENYRHFIKDLGKAQAQWQNIVDNIRWIKLPVKTNFAKEIATEAFLDLNKLPHLPVLATLVQLFSKPLQNVGVSSAFALHKKFQRFEKSYDLLDKFGKMYGSEIYLGMKFYSDEDFSRKFPVSASENPSDFPGGRDLFEEHLAVGLALDRAGAGKKLLPLISTFRLNTTNVKEIATTIPTTIRKIAIESKKVMRSLSRNELENFSRKALQQALKLFQDVENAKNIDPQVLIDFLNDLPSIITNELKSLHDRYNANLTDLSKLAIQKAIETRFRDNFSRTYFEVLKVGSATGDVAQRISEVFKTSELREAFEPIRLRYPTENTDEIATLFDLLETILSQLDLSHEKLQLLEKLSDERILAVPITEFNQLLTAIVEKGSSGFIHFMEVAELFSAAPIEGLVLKASYFISEALPRLRNDLKQLNEMDVIALVDDLLLAGKRDEINSTLPINPDLTHVYQRVTESLSQSPADPVTIERLLEEAETMDLGLSSLKAVIDLKEHFTQVKIPETRKVRVSKTRIVEEEEGTVATVGKTLKNIFSTVTFGWIESAAKSHVETYQEEELQTLHKELDHKLIEEALREITQLSQESTTYTFALSQTFGLIEDLVNHYPAAKSQLLQLARHYLSYRPQETQVDASQISIAFRHLSLLHKEFLALENQDLIISLCEHFGAKEGIYNFETLLTLMQGQALTLPKERTEAVVLDFKHYLDLEPRAKKQVLSVIASLLNNEKPCSLKDIQMLVNCCHDSAYLTILDTLFKSAPFPTLDKIEQWRTEAQAQEAESSSVYITRQYIAWSKEPVARESFNSKGERVNGFDLEYAKQQRQFLYGITYNEGELVALNEEIKAAQQLDTEKLLRQIAAIKHSANVNPATLTALMAELLYRTKGLPQEGVGDSREWGRSFEINTTQYLAIHSMLKAGGHVTSQIGTGEGKSRIMMISIACQYALGKTVDFVTADVSLATRDYLEYQAFFKALGAQTNFIRANTPPSEYRIGGINFSDASNLSLFRNKAYSEGYGDLVIASKPKDRALMLDEADKTYFDASDTRFNYSAQADPLIRDMPWIYELMIEFFSISEHRDLYDGETSDADRCNQAFKDFARGKLDEAQMKRLEEVSVKQLEAWESSALTALALQFQEDFTIRSGLTLLTKHGPKQVSQAQLINGSRASENAKFSFGVHQCLHARLNQERKIAKSASPEQLTQLQRRLVDDEFRYPFSIDSENQIVYSSTSKSLLDDYAEGELLAVTGTAGSIQEREEAKATYGSKTKAMTFIDIPRHRGQKRIDLPVILASDQTAHYQKILSSVKKLMVRNQPILLVCENDEESQKLYQFLDSNLNDVEKAQLKRISADTTLTEEASHIKNNAGKSGAITVTTAMLGRGTDIKLHGEAKNQGLSVIATYLPRVRDYFQIIGRSGRFGAKGDSRLILNKEELKVSFGVNVLPSEFYTATESYLKHQQTRMDAFAQRQRVIKDAVGDFRLTLTQQFFNDFYAPTYQEGNDKDTLLHSWRAFFDKTDKVWNDLWPKLSEELASERVSREAINELLVQYQASVQEEWNALREYIQIQIKEGKILSKAGEATVDGCLCKRVAPITLDKKADDLIYNHSLLLPQYRTVLAKHYDKAFTGRAVLYQSLGARLRSFFSNIAAAWRGEGLWFPNLQAARNGHMSWSQFFLGTRGTPLSNPQISIQAEVENSSTDSLETSTRLIQSSLDSRTRTHFASDETILPTTVGHASKELVRYSKDDLALFNPKNNKLGATSKSRRASNNTCQPASDSLSRRKNSL